MYTNCFNEELLSPDEVAKSPHSVQPSWVVVVKPPLACCVKGQVEGGILSVRLIQPLTQWLANTKTTQP